MFRITYTGFGFYLTEREWLTHLAKVNIEQMSVIEQSQYVVEFTQENGEAAGPKVFPLQTLFPVSTLFVALT